MQSKLTNSPAHVLLFGHEASRTGAPLLLLHLLRWLWKNTDWTYSVALWNGGELEREYAAVAPTVNLGAWPWGGIRRRQKFLGRLGISQVAGAINRLRVKRVIRRPVPDLIYANSIVAAGMLDYLDPIRQPVLCHVHELEMSIRFGVPAPRLAPALRRVNRFIACSEAVRENLIERHRVAPGDVRTIHGFIPGEVPAVNEAGRLSTRREIGIPSDALVVGGAGSIGWWKGSDIFLQVAAEVRRGRPGLPVYFLWVGGGTQEQANHDARLLGISDCVRFVGFKSNPSDYFGAMDAFLLTSREDSFPLVCLEAASLGKPVICFARAGGAPEFVAGGAGFVVPYLDVQQMSSCLCQLLDNPGERVAVGQKGRDKVLSQHRIDLLAPRILATMRELIEAGASEQRAEPQPTAAGYGLTEGR